MKKSHKIVLALDLLFMTLVIQVSTVRAQSVEEQHEAVIELFMNGIRWQFSYEEAEAYISQEEAYLLETITFRSLSSYGIERGHSTTHAIGLNEYLQNYFQANSDANTLAVLYPYQVDFVKVTKNLFFYEARNTSVPVFYVNNDQGMLTIDATRTYQDAINGPTSTFNSETENTETFEYMARGADWKQRTENINPQVSVWTKAHRREFIFSFLINRDVGVSLLLWD